MTSSSHNNETDPILNKYEKKIHMPNTSRFHIQSQQEKSDKQTDLELVYIKPLCSKTNVFSNSIN